MQGPEPFNVILSVLSSTKFQIQVSHKDISSVIYITAPVVSYSRTTGASVYNLETENMRKEREEQDMGKGSMICVRVCVETQMTDRNAGKLL